MALPGGFLDELRARTPLAGLVGQRVRLTRSGRNWKGCCPFHNEKTPSFYVYENGFHCFGCGASGDAISFVMQTQGLGFMDAVGQLAASAGMEVPKPTPEAEAAERRRLDLFQVMQAAADSYRRRLFLPEGAAALAYLRGRGLSDATIAEFGLGWSGEGRGALAADLARQEIGVDQLVACGLMRAGEDGRPPHDLFFNRVMFPIRDARGRIISFGGRIMGEGQPKYVNGPETELFAKRRTLYALDRAAAACRTGATLLVVEGYMDVIALHQDGFGGAVAPLGTALTEEQFELLWRLSPEPVLCFDGDGAGRRAALRAIDLALPMLRPDRGLRLARLPEGQDPDSLLRAGADIAALLERAPPLADVLYDLLAETHDLARPEQRAAFRAKLDATAARIGDRHLGREYRSALLDRFYAPRPRRGAPRPARVLPVARGAIRPEEAAAERGRAMVAILLRHPDLLHDVDEAFGAIDLPPPLIRLRAAMLSWMDSAETLDSAGLMSHLNASGLAAEAAQALSAMPLPLPVCALPDSMPAEAEAGWWHLFGLMNPGRLEEEVEAAQSDFAARADSAAERRLVALCTARDALRRGETGPAPDD